MTLDFEPGQLLADRYRLAELIGRGAVGSVWRATDASRGTQVAIKVIVPVDADGVVSQNKVGRFVREARAMARLKSPHVVGVLDQGQCPHPADDVEVVYLAMELLEGESLRERLRRDETLTPAETLRIMRHVGRAVALAHQRGIVHRDLKPANIYLAESPEGGYIAKVLDFGMVKSVGMPLATFDQVQTELGRPIGTPYYMSPEQARGQGNVDHRTDLWSMGVITYECLIGQRPFRGKSLARVFTQIATGALPTPSQEGQVPPDFDAWFRRAVCRDIQQRYQSARVLVDELGEVIGSSSATTLPKPHGPGVTVVTVSDVHGPEPEAPASDPNAEQLSFSDRTLRRQPRSGRTSFVGRETALSEIDEAIANHCRVITLRGYRGVGKARLAREYGRKRPDAYPGGVWLSSLADIHDADGMWLAIGCALGVHLGEGDPAVHIGRALAGLGRVLVVIENVDEVRSHVATAVSRWLTEAPHAVFLVTSRRSLALPTERVVSLPALEFPQADAVTNLGETRRWKATQLLLRRAIGFDRRLLASDAGAAAMGNLAWRAQGNALALELIASTLGRMSPDEAFASLGHLLMHEQGTDIIRPELVLDGILSWAIDQLLPHERDALTQMAAFSRGFTIASAEAVVDLGGYPDAPPVERLAKSLVRRGLLERGLDLSGADRYTMHPAVLRACRTRLAEHLSEDDARALWERHGRYFSQLGSEEALASLARAGGYARRARLLSELENLRVATEQAAARRDGEVAATCALALAAGESELGRHEAAAKRLVGPAHVSETPEPQQRRCLVAHARALAVGGRHEVARRSVERARESLASAAIPDRVAVHLADAAVELSAGHTEHARAALDAAHEATDAVDARSRADVALARGWLLRAESDPAGAVAAFQRAVEDYGTAGATAGAAEALEEMASSAMQLGRFEAAADGLRRALDLCQRLGHRLGEARLLGEQGELALERGEANAAVAQLEHAVGRCREIGAVDLEGRFLGILGTALSLTDSYDQARSRLAQADQLLVAEGEQALPERCAVLCRRAALMWRQRDESAARAFYDEAREVADDMIVPKGPTLSRMLASLRAAFG